MVKMTNNNLPRAFRTVVWFSFTLYLISGCAGFGRVTTPGDSPREGVNARSFDEAIKNSRSVEGLFTVYQDTLSGETHLAVREDQLGREFIYFSHTADGVVEAGHFRGRFAGNKVFAIRKYFDRIEFVTKNTSFYFDEDNPLSLASDANISPSVLISEKIVGHREDEGLYLISSDDLFLSENLHQVKPVLPPGIPPGSRFTLGNLSRDRSRYLDIRSYPKNTEVMVEYVYENSTPFVRGGRDVTDPRFVSIRYQHSFIEMPENDFKPRFEDPRLGYFTQQVDDMTSIDPAPYRDPIHRWHLVKKDPEAVLSEPVEPIVWWIENTTPHEFRLPIKEGVLAWNEAFEQAGFKNAIQVKIQPDDAEWDANDIRYNVLRWTSSPRPPFAGYGPSFVNPRTGQLLGANVMLEFMFFRRNLVDSRLFETAALELFDDLKKEEYNHHDVSGCSFGFGMQQNLLAGLSIARGLDLSEAEENRLVNEALKMLALHEIGHTLGLNHNMKASFLHSPESIYNRKITEEYGLTGSVMDYAVVNLSPEPGNENQFFDVRPGIYDRWAIEYGYSPALGDSEAEQARLNEILSRSSEWGHDFGNDADDMRSPGKAIDPRVMTWDLSSDPVQYAADRIGLLGRTTESILERYVNEGQSYEELRSVYLVLSAQHARMASVISRYIGGVYVDRSFPEQDSDLKPFTPVSKSDQKRAMDALNAYVFAPEAFERPSEIYNYLQMQRRGFNFFNTTEDPKIHDRALNIQKSTLNHVLHPVVLKRMTDSQIYGNEYPVAEFMQDLTNGIFQKDINSHVNSFRRNLQNEYVNRLIQIQESPAYDHNARSIALHNIYEIRDLLQNRARSDLETMAHTRSLLFTIEKALEPPSR